MRDVLGSIKDAGGRVGEDVISSFHLTLFQFVYDYADRTICPGCEKQRGRGGFWHSSIMKSLVDIRDLKGGRPARQSIGFCASLFYI